MPWEALTSSDSNAYLDPVRLPPGFVFRMPEKLGRAAQDLYQHILDGQGENATLAETSRFRFNYPDSLFKAAGKLRALGPTTPRRERTRPFMPSPRKNARPPDAVHDSPAVLVRPPSPQSSDEHVDPSMPSTPSRPRVSSTSLAVLSSATPRPRPTPRRRKRIESPDPSAEANPPAGVTMHADDSVEHAVQAGPTDEGQAELVAEELPDPPAHTEGNDVIAAEQPESRRSKRVGTGTRQVGDSAGGVGSRSAEEVVEEEPKTTTRKKRKG